MIQAITGEGNILEIKNRNGMDKAESIKESIGSYTINLLTNYNRNKSEIENLKLAIEEISLENDGVGAIDYSRDRTGATNKINRIVEDLAIDNIKKKKWYEKELRKKEIEVEKVDNALKALDQRAREIIIKYYIKNMRLKDIAVEMYNSDCNICKIKNKGIKVMEDIIWK